MQKDIEMILISPHDLQQLDSWFLDILSVVRDYLEPQR